MRPTHSSALMTSASLLLFACALPASTGMHPPAVVTDSALATASIGGAVMAPAGVIAAGGANVIAAGGANVIAAGGANVIAAGGANYRALQAGAGLLQSPLAHAEVFVADMSGVALVNVAHTTTDASGKYTLSGLPVGLTLQVMAHVTTSGGKDAYLRTIVKTSSQAANANVDAGTTLMAATLTGSQSPLGNLDLATFANAAAELDDDFAHATLPDWSSSASMQAAVTTTASSDATLQSMLNSMQPSAKSNGATQAGASPLPTSAAGASSGPAPSTTPSQAPTAAPTSAPTAGPAASTSGATVTSIFKVQMQANPNLPNTSISGVQIKTRNEALTPAGQWDNNTSFVTDANGQCTLMIPHEQTATDKVDVYVFYAGGPTNGELIGTFSVPTGGTSLTFTPAQTPSRTLVPIGS